MRPRSGWFSEGGTRKKELLKDELDVDTCHAPRLKVWDALEKVKPVSSFRNVNSPADK